MTRRNLAFIDRQQFIAIQPKYQNIAEARGSRALSVAVSVRMLSRYGAQHEIVSVGTDAGPGLPIIPESLFIYFFFHFIYYRNLSPVA
jgi:hypothetical protein